jgi:hypothetical protein
VVETKPGCFEKTTLNLTVLPQIVINDLSIIGDNGTGNGAILVEIVGGSPPFTYLWSSGQTTGSIFQVSHGSYTLTATDSKGCSESFNFVVPEVTATNEPVDANNELKIWPTIISSGGKINVFCAGNKSIELKGIQWWDVSGHLISSINNPINLPVAIEAPVATSGTLCFVRLTRDDGNSSWFKVVIQ